MNNIIIESKDYDKVYKTRLGNFLEETKNKLVKHIKEISEGDDGFIEDYDKPIIDNKITSANFQEPIIYKDNVGKIVLPMSTSQPMQINKIPSNSINPYTGNKLIRNYIFNTQFRDNFFTTRPENSIFTLPIKMKNVVSLSLSAVQIPNVFFVFSNLKGTNQIFIHEETTGLEALVKLPEGNYTTLTFPEALERAINLQVIGVYPSRFKVTIENPTNFTVISNTTHNFYMNLYRKEYSDADLNLICRNTFSNPDDGNDRFKKLSPSEFCNTMGYIIGYRRLEYSGSNGYISESMFNQTGVNDYVYFSLNEYTTNSIYKVNYGVLPTGLIGENILAMVPLDTPKFTTVFSNNSNFIYKTRIYNGPIDILKFNVKILNNVGNPVDLYDTDFAFNLQVTSIYDPTLPYQPVGPISLSV